MLFKSTSKYGTINQIFTNNNNNNGYQNEDDQEFVHQVGQSMISDNKSGINATGFGNSTKRLMISSALACKATNSAHSNNLNQNYFQLE